jgi:MFS family permease
MPLYPLYALLFADTGLSGAEISALFAIWSIVGVVAEVPSGAWADRYSRRTALVLAGVLQAVGYVVWIALPGFAGFAAGFVLWGVGGSLASGSFQALVYEGLAAARAEGRYATVLGRAEAAGMAVQAPMAGAASALFAAGGYALAGWVSVAICLVAAAVAATLPDARPAAAAAGPRAGYLATLRAGVGEVAASPPVRRAALAVAVLTALDGLEEYFPLLAVDWGVPAGAVPIALLAIPLVGALGAALGGRAMGLGRAGVLFAMLGAAAALGAADLAAHPAGLVGVTLFYGVYRLMLVVADARLQERIAGPARATATSVAGLAGDVGGAALYGAWAVGGLGLFTAVAVVCALALPRLLGRSAAPAEPPARVPVLRS